MNLKNLTSKIESLEKISKILESKKNITLINILKLSKQVGKYFDRAQQSKDFIDFINSKYEINNNLLIPQSSILKPNKKNKEALNYQYPCIYVYVSEKQENNLNLYSKFEKQLDNIVNFKRDYFIAIGESALKYTQQKNANVIFSYKENDVEYLSDFLPKLIDKFINSNGFHNVKFIINSSKTKDKILNVLPIDKINFELSHKNNILNEKFDIKNLKIYPDIEEFAKSEVTNYLNYMILSLLVESALIREKYILVDQNQKINDLDKKIALKTRMYLRAKRELEVEEISILTKKKDLLHTNEVSDDQN
ncbi:hypothetical protein V2E24_01115 [Mycoplasmopsis ciconiae]|uniref:ATP synthase gamma chain n=1 Tax=Mycoplasmopsis ciconiae TaxID=561067 RepID=A0ABU7ML45_9BACT|nr:hypothetical protein [Mycoplasmopsis ciconiae]